MSDPIPIATQATAVPGWLKWLVGVLGASLAAAGPGVGSLYLSAKGQARDAETARAETASRAEVLRFEAFAKASRANDLSDELGQCQTTLDKLIEKGYIEFFYKDLYNRKGGRHKRFYKISSPGMETLEEALELQKSLWKGFPNFAAE